MRTDGISQEEEEKEKKRRMNARCVKFRKNWGIILTEQSFIWEKEYPAQKDPTQKAWFMVAHITHEEVNSVRSYRGSEWDLIPVADFFQRPDVIDAPEE